MFVKSNGIILELTHLKDPGKYIDEKHGRGHSFDSLSDTIYIVDSYVYIRPLDIEGNRVAFTTETEFNEKVPFPVEPRSIHEVSSSWAPIVPASTTTTNRTDDENVYWVSGTQGAGTVQSSTISVEKLKAAADEYRARNGGTFKGIITGARQVAKGY